MINSKKNGAVVLSNDAKQSDRRTIFGWRAPTLALAMGALVAPLQGCSPGEYIEALLILLALLLPGMGGGADAEAVRVFTHTELSDLLIGLLDTIPELNDFVNDAAQDIRFLYFEPAEETLRDICTKLALTC